MTWALVLFSSDAHLLELQIGANHIQIQLELIVNLENYRRNLNSNKHTRTHNHSNFKRKKWKSIHKSSKYYLYTSENISWSLSNLYTVVVVFLTNSRITQCTFFFFSFLFFFLLSVVLNFGPRWRESIMFAFISLILLKIIIIFGSISGERQFVHHPLSIGAIFEFL